jgi:YD repeat-containing protein
MTLKVLRGITWFLVLVFAFQNLAPTYAYLPALTSTSSTKIRQVATLLPGHTAANQVFTETEYDDLGRRKAEIDPESGRVEFGYDDLGRLKNVTQKAKLNSNDVDQVTEYGYDELGNKLYQ